VAALRVALAIASSGLSPHLPQIEQPGATFGALDAFIRKNPGRPAA
jgi:hypothetical protein